MSTRTRSRARARSALAFSRHRSPDPPPEASGHELPENWPAGLRSVLTNQTVPTVIAAAFIMAIVSWPVMDLVPQAGLDASWEAGLAMAFEHHVAWGPRMDFTYGPLGFLIIPTLYYPTTSLLSICYLLLTRGALFTLLLRASTRNFSPYFAILAAFVVGATAIGLVDPADILMGIELLLANEAFQSRGSPRTATAFTLVLGAVAGAGLLVKFSVGLLGFGLLAVVAASTVRWRRNSAEALGTFAAATFLAWLATGNSPAHIFTYLHMSISIAGGYAGAMSLEIGRIDEWYYAAIIIACLATCLAWSLAGADKRRAVCQALAFAGFAWVALKEGYVRHDGHDLEFFGLMLVAFLAVPWPKLRLPSARLATALGVATVFAWTAAGGVPSNLLDLSYDTHELASSIITTLGRGRAATIAQARATLQAGYQIPPSFLGRLHDQTVAIETYENTVAWAYPTLKWDPEPVLQQYSAYETSLDNLDASFLRSQNAPTRILAQPATPFEGINQDTYFEAPTADVTLLCRYAQAGATASWQLLVRVPNRCGKLVPLGTVHARFGETIDVPQAPPGDAVVATFHGVGSSLLYRLENLLLKARAIQMTTPNASYRFIAGTAADLHIMRVPSTLSYNPTFAPPQIPFFTLYERNLLTDGGRYRVMFFAMPLAPPKRSA